MRLLFVVKAVCLSTCAQFVWVVHTVFSSLRILWQPLHIPSNYKFLPIFLTTVSVLAIAACHSGTLQLEQMQKSSTAMGTSKSGLVRTPAETQVVNDAFGKVKIPLHPQRIVALDDHHIIDSLLALGVEPVGVISCSGCQEAFPGIPNDLVADIPDVGNRGQPSLEKILILKPDLILGEEGQGSSYEILSKIAPTVRLNLLTMSNFKERLRYFAQMLGKSDRAEELLAQYENRIQQLRQQLGKQIETKTISVIYPSGSGDVFYISRPGFRVHDQVMSDIGLQRIQLDQVEHELPFSIEVLSKYDADILFILTDYLATEFREVLRQPLWSTLKAVQNKQVYKVNWTAGGPIGANRILDDLFKYLVDIP
ncbi:MAG: iron-siderophore ABC transporter substrate-binding protein [Microcoleus sp. SU_5_3]|nr:iron-siderophore ABC transporter substrate-binding protein [Microcoleus sp. SU_5_3]